MTKEWINLNLTWLCEYYWWYLMNEIYKAIKLDNHNSISKIILENAKMIYFFSQFISQNLILDSSDF